MSKTSTKTLAKATMAQINTLPNSSINHALDTIITLPKSKITIVVKKNYPSKKISAMDNYFSKHTVSKTSQPQTINPNYEACPLRYDTSWELQNQYKSLTGKHMGIWVTPGVISWSKAYDQYGFNELYMDFQDSTSAFQAGFKPDSIMVRLYTTTPSTYITQSRSYGYYFFDEPIENNISVAAVQSYAEIILNKNSNSKCVISDYRWTKSAPCNLFVTYDGPKIWSYLDASTNMEVMCDLYQLNDACGQPADFWNEYFNYYNPYSKMNWLNNSMNNSGGWSDCFHWMNVHGINNVWLYANNTGNEGVIQNWCSLAWQYAWLLRNEGQLVTVWQNTDGTCDPVYGQWQIVDAYYIAYRWTSY